MSKLKRFKNGVYMKEYKAAIIGCGSIAASHFRAYKDNAVKLVAVHDLNPLALAAFSEEHGIQSYRDYRLLLDSEDIDILSICTPPSSHEELAVTALSRNINVLLEKPMANSLDSAKKIYDAAGRSKGLLMIGFRHRFFSAIQKIRELVTRGRIGNPVMFFNNFSAPAFGMKDKWFSRKEISGGGSMLDTGSHSVDLFRFLIGEVSESKAILASNFLKNGVEDTAVLLVKSESGCIGTLSSSWGAGCSSAFIDIHGDMGRICYDYASGELKLRGREGSWTQISVGSSANGAFSEQLKAFLDSIETASVSPVSSADGLRAMEIIFSNYK